MSRGEGVKKLGDLFEVYRKRLSAPQGAVIKEFQEVVRDLFGFDIPKEACRYSTHTKTLTVVNFGPIKSELLIRKQEVLTHLKGRLGDKSAPKEII